MPALNDSILVSCTGVSSGRPAIIYLLLANPERTVANQFDVVKQGSMYGKPVTKVERSTFIFNRDGKLAAEFRAVKPEGHAAEMLTAVQNMP